MEDVQVPVGDKHKSPKNIYMLDHCLFCVRKLSEARSGGGGGTKKSRKQDKQFGDKTEEGDEPVLRCTASFLTVDRGPRAFERIWKCLLQKKWMEGEGLPEIMFWVGKKLRGSVFCGYPAICEECGKEVKRLNKLITELVEKVREIRGIVRSSWEEGRVDKLQDILGYAMEVDKNGMVETLAFLKMLRQEGIEKEYEAHGRKWMGDETDIFANSADVGGVPSSEGLSQMPLPSDVSTSALSLLQSGETAGGSSHRRSRRLEAKSIAENSGAVRLKIRVYGGEEDDFAGGDSDAEVNNDDDDALWFPPGDSDAQINFDTDKVEVKYETESVTDMDYCPEETPGNFDSEDSNSHANDPLADTSMAQDQTPSSSYKCKPWKRKQGQKCDFCREIVPHTQNLEHMRGHVGDYVVKCPNPECPKVFSCTQQMVRLHTMQCLKPLMVDGELRKTCESCNFETFSTRVFTTHLTDIHENSIKNFTCPVTNCSASFSVRQSVELHIFRGHVSKSVWGQKYHNGQTCLECKPKLNVIIYEEMEAHLRTEHKVDTIIPCKLCPYRFSKWEQLLYHMDVHVKLEQDLVCNICSDIQIETKFSSVSQLRQHFFTMHQIGQQFVCEYCTKGFFTKHALTGHQTNVHQAINYKNPKQICKVCNQHFSSSKVLIRHNITVHGAPPIRCRFCERSFNSVEVRKKHELEHRGVEQIKEHTCPMSGCGKIFGSFSALRNHLATLEHASENGQQQCLECKDKFRMVNCDEMEDHLRTEHQAETIITCNMCPYRFSNWEGLLNHLTTHAMRVPNITCIICSANQVEVKPLFVPEMRKHYFTEHQIGEQFICELCSKDFFTKNMLRAHQKKWHKSGGGTVESEATHVPEEQNFNSDPVDLLQKPEPEVFACPVPGCGKVYKMPRFLRKHLDASVHKGLLFKSPTAPTNHSNNKRRRPLDHVCEVCGKGFTTSNHLNEHKKSHKTERDVVCDVCGERFKKERILENHKRIHTGERPFECPVCHQRFRQWSVLYRHKMSHERKGSRFKPNGPLKKIRKRLEPKD